MPRRSNNPPMTPSEMALEAKAQSESRIYQGRGQTVEANRAVVGEIVGNMAEQMKAAADQSRRFDLSDLEQVNATAREYVAACAAAGVLPTVTGAAAAMGRTRTALYKYAADHKAFSDWLTEFSDCCGECAASAAIHGAVQAIPTIFTLKARHNWRDNIVIETAPANNRNNLLGYDISPEEAEHYAQMLAEKYAELPED